VIGQHTLVQEAMNITVNLPLQIGHSPAPVYQKQSNGEDNFQAGSESKVINVIWFDDVISIYSTKLNYDINSIYLEYFHVFIP
jgi:hypothetical protein